MQRFFARLLGVTPAAEERRCYRVFESRVLVKEFGAVEPGLYRFDKRTQRTIGIEIERAPLQVGVSGCRSHHNIPTLERYIFQCCNAIAKLNVRCCFDTQIISI